MANLYPDEYNRRRAAWLRTDTGTAWSTAHSRIRSINKIIAGELWRNWSEPTSRSSVVFFPFFFYVYLIRFLWENVILIWIMANLYPDEYNTELRLLSTPMSTTLSYNTVLLDGNLRESGSEFQRTLPEYTRLDLKRSVLGAGILSFCRISWLG